MEQQPSQSDGTTDPVTSSPASWACPKCHGQEHREEVVRMTGDGLSRYLDLQRFRFRCRICEQCGKAEFYSTESSLGDDILDALFGG